MEVFIWVSTEMSLVEGITFILLEEVQWTILIDQEADQLEVPVVDQEADLAADLAADQTLDIKQIILLWDAYGSSSEK